MTDETKDQTGATRREPKPSELLSERLRLTDAERADVDARLNDPDRVARKVDWLDAGPDPLGANWGWIDGLKPETPPAS